MTDILAMKYNFELEIARLITLERSCQRDEAFDYCSVRDMSFEEIDRLTNPSVKRPHSKPHRASVQVYEICGHITALKSMREYNYGDPEAAVDALLDVLSLVPATASWVPVAAFATAIAG